MSTNDDGTATVTILANWFSDDERADVASRVELGQPRWQAIREVRANREPGRHADV